MFPMTKYANAKRRPFFLVLSIALGLLSFLAIVLAQQEPQKPTYAYIGTDKCKLCHGNVYENWAKTSHAKTLEEKDAPDDFRGCESCHGPGSEHAGKGGKKQFITNPKNISVQELSSVCGKCHFEDPLSKAPASWQRLKGKHWMKSEHSRKLVSCVQCHSVHNAKQEKYLIQTKEELCVSCHAEKKDDVHLTVSGIQRDCSVCHNQHGTGEKHMLLSDLTSTCTGCHDSENKNFKKAHLQYPVETMKKYTCAYCHDPHSNNQAAKFLKAFTHPPFEAKKCTTCHNEPKAAQPFGLKKPMKELCTSCHGKIAQELKESSLVHFPVEKGLCTACHTPHRSKEKKLFVDTPLGNACFTCHSQIEELVFSKFKHPPAQKLCTNCHKPHASNHAKLFKDEVVTVCKSCHASQAGASHPLGPKAINPNTGEPLTCATCHKPHGGPFAFILKNEPMQLCLTCHKK